MHDYFDILGLSREARAIEVRSAWARRARRWHPDFEAPDAAFRPAPTAVPPIDVRDRDAAIDFLEMAPIVERMHAAFFAGA